MTSGALAGVGVDQIFANATIHTWLTAALVDICLTVGARVAGCADAAESCGATRTCGTVQALQGRVGSTKVNGGLAVGSSVSRCAVTSVARWAAAACAAVQTLCGWVRRTMVNFGLAVGTSVSRCTIASVAVDLVGAHPIVLAWLTLTLVDIGLTVLASVARDAVAGEAAGAAAAGSAVQTLAGRIRLAKIDWCLAVGASPARCTVAYKRGGGARAGSAILTQSLILTLFPILRNLVSVANVITHSIIPLCHARARSTVTAKDSQTP